MLLLLTLISLKGKAPECECQSESLTCTFLASRCCYQAVLGDWDSRETGNTQFCYLGGSRWSEKRTGIWLGHDWYFVSLLVLHSFGLLCFIPLPLDLVHESRDDHHVKCQWSRFSLSDQRKVCLFFVVFGSASKLPLFVLFFPFRGSNLSYKAFIVMVCFCSFADLQRAVELLFNKKSWSK